MIIYKFVRSSKDIKVMGYKNNYFVDANKKIVPSLRRVKGHKIVMVPNMNEYVRLMDNYGPIGMGFRKLLEINVKDYFRLAIFGIKNISGIIKKDFSTLSTLMCYFDILITLSAKPAIFLLHPKIFDLALSNNNMKIIEGFVDVVKNNTDARTGVFTFNPELLKYYAPILKSQLKFIGIPLNEKGYRVFPNEKLVEKLVDDLSDTFQIIAMDYRAKGTIPTKTASKYLEKLKVRLAVD